MAEIFSEPYVRRLAEETADDDFIIIYHNCGDNTVKITESILRTGCSAYHFGNSVSMLEVLQKLPPDVIAMGNIDPVSQFRSGTPDSVYAQTKKLLEECGAYPNFVLSSGCDIPPCMGKHRRILRRCRTAPSTAGDEFVKRRVLQSSYQSFIKNAAAKIKSLRQFFILCASRRGDKAYHGSFVQTSHRTRSSYVSLRTTSLDLPPDTITTAGRGILL